ncbi:MAG TPA: S-adenosylmethionine decarboxylase [Bacillota bacterium]|nr:S-adenosylmethionine decarboxylase [Bacillota bacterium]
MNHFVMDAFRGYRSRLDDVLLVHELLEEIPHQLGMKAVMPPFVLPYYNGVVPEDCGISAFVFLAGGHFTIHTFSYREAYFVDLLTPDPIDAKELERKITNAFPAEIVNSYCAKRGEVMEGLPTHIAINKETDFGPHVMMDLENYKEPLSMDELFERFDKMPYKIDMTPIIRPYAIKGTYNGKKVLSILTMIAESHISLHCFPDEGKAYFDLFSCRFFDYNNVMGTIKKQFNGDIRNETLIARGSKYQHLRTSSESQIDKAKSWLDNID